MERQDIQLVVLENDLLSLVLVAKLHLAVVDIFSGSPLSKRMDPVDKVKRC